jgi:hypothetical protein
MAPAIARTILSDYDAEDGLHLVIGVRSPADVLRLRGIFSAVGEASRVRVHDDRGVRDPRRARL